MYLRSRYFWLEHGQELAKSLDTEIEHSDCFWHLKLFDSLKQILKVYLIEKNYFLVKRMVVKSLSVQSSVLPCPLVVVHLLLSTLLTSDSTTLMTKPLSHLTTVISLLSLSCTNNLLKKLLIGCSIDLWKRSLVMHLLESFCSQITCCSFKK